MKIGAKLHRLRLEKSLSGNELAKRCGVSQSTISDIEKDKRSPTLETLDKICSTLEVNIIDVLPDEKRLGKSFDETEAELINYFQQMNQEQKTAFLKLIRAFFSKK